MERSKRIKSIKRIIKSAEDKGLYLYTSASSEAIESIMNIGLLSGEKLYEDRDLLEKARPDKKEREEWIKKFEKRRYIDLDFKGPSAFFSLVDESKISDKHPIKRGDLKMISIDLSAMLDDYEFTEDLLLFGVELEPYRVEMTDKEYFERQRFLSIEEVKSIRDKGSEEIWKNYDNPEGTHYASDVPHVFVFTKDGMIDPKYLKKVGSPFS